MLTPFLTIVALFPSSSTLGQVKIPAPFRHKKIGMIAGGGSRHTTTLPYPLSALY